MPALLAGVVRLTIEEYRLAWERAGLSTMHWNLSPAGTAEQSVEHRAAVRAHALDGLQRKGLAGETGLADELVDALGLVARAGAELDAEISRGAEPTVRLVAAAQSQLAMLAVLDHEFVDLHPVPADGFVTATAEFITGAPAAPGKPVTVLADLLAPGRGLAPEQVARRLADGGVPRHDIAALHDLTDGPKLAVARICASRTGPGGARRDGEFSLTYAQTRRGGIAFHYHRRDGRTWCTVTPADTLGLARLLHELLGAAGR